MIDYKNNYSSYISVNKKCTWDLEELIEESEDFFKNCAVHYKSEYVDIKRLGILNINVEYRIKQILRDYCERTK